MTFGRRLRFYFLGVALGFIAVYIISKNRDSNPWLPKDQIKAKLADVPLTFDQKVWCQMQCLNLDSTAIQQLIDEADIDFKQSDIHRDSCPVYHMESHWNNDKILVFKILSCDKNSEIRELSDANSNCECYEN